MRGLTRAYATHGGNFDAQVEEVLRTLDAVERELRRRYSFVLGRKRVLDMGSGQRLAHLAYFARDNTATGIDLDVVPQGWDLRAYARMLSKNGLERTIKTLGRKALRIDAQFRRRYERRLGPVRKLDVRQMDAARLDFPNNSFDLVHAHSVFHHLPNVEVVLEEIRRVLQPGGVFHASLHLYTSRNGSLDPRHGDELWPHLRGIPTQSPVYLNRFRLADWYRTFGALDSCEVTCNQPERHALEPKARELGLDDYELDELLTHNLTVFWQKPLLPF